MTYASAMISPAETMSNNAHPRRVKHDHGQEQHVKHGADIAIVLATRYASTLSDESSTSLLR
jgi:hypothetical protein